MPRRSSSTSIEFGGLSRGGDGFYGGAAGGGGVV